MMTYLIYEAKVAAALAIFYMFFRLLLKKETFHRFNRVVLLAATVLSFALPFCIITVHKTVEMMPTIGVGDAAAAAALAPVAAEAPDTPWWHVALAVLFFAGVAFVLVRALVSVFSILRIIRRGELVREEDGCRIVVTERDIDPFSWMSYIVLSRKDWEGPHAPIITHEKAHIDYRHSVDLLLVDFMSALQWFNPAIWMLRADLQELHEYEADDAVLRSGANLKEYQYLLIRKAVSKSGYSVANSFNHSILKNRITMMSKSKTPLSRGLRTLWALPLVCLAIGLQAQTVYVQQDKDSEKIVSDKADGIVLTVGIGQDGKGVVTSAGKEMAIADVEEYISGLQLTPGTAVEIAADASVPMGYINDVKDQLRGAKALKVKYKSPLGSDDVTRFLPPQVKEALKKTQKKYPEELLPGVNREDIFIVRINSRDKYFFGNSAGVDDDDMVERAKSFLEEHGRNTHFSLRTDRATSFGAYYHIQSLLVRAYYEVRTKKAQALYGKALTELSDEELQAIYELYPLSITE